MKLSNTSRLNGGRKSDFGKRQVLRRDGKQRLRMAHKHNICNAID